MNAIEFLKTTRRMCTEYESCADCLLSESSGYDGCPVHPYTGDNRNIGEIIEIVENWAKKNPERTYKTMFLDKFPNATIEHDTLIPRACVEQVFGELHTPDFCSVDCCQECWLRQYPEEDS